MSNEKRTGKRENGRDSYNIRYVDIQGKEHTEKNVPDWFERSLRAFKKQGAIKTLDTKKI